jgi:hypothetical protein
MGKIDIEKVDEVMNRTGAEYHEVRRALLETDGDVDQAVAYLTGRKEAEGSRKKDWRKAVEEIWEKGNASYLLVEKRGENLLRIPLTVGAVGIVLAPVAAIVGFGAAWITEYTIKIVMDDGEVININERIKD